MPVRKVPGLDGPACSGSCALVKTVNIQLCANALGRKASVQTEKSGRVARILYGEI